MSEIKKRMRSVCEDGCPLTDNTMRRGVSITIDAVAPELERLEGVIKKQEKMIKEQERRITSLGHSYSNHHHSMGKEQ